MKRLFALCPLIFLIWATSSHATPKETQLAVNPKAVKITYLDLPKFTDAHANFTGVKKKKLNGKDLMKDPKNDLVLKVSYDFTGTADNLIWSLEEWSGGPFDRDLSTDGIQSEIFIGKGRLFVNKKLKGEIEGGELKNKKVQGTTNFEQGNGSLVIKDPKLNSHLVLFGGHQGSVSVTGKLDSLGNAEVVLFKGKVTGTAFIDDSGDSNDPGDKHQVTMTINIEAKDKP